MTYQNVLKTLVQIEREALARRIESKELIRTAEAMERFGKVIGEIKGDLLGLANSVASQANPDNQGKAFKVIDEKVNALLKKWSNSAGMVVSEMTEQTVNTKGADLEAFGEEE
jgi:RNase P/RNase MRP subunit p29